MGFRDTRLWQEGLGPRDGDSSEVMRARETLRTAYEQARERAIVISGEVRRDQPDLTLHDISHIDALWEVADEILGSSSGLSALETFVLGGAFLVHDLALTLAAWTGGIDELDEDQLLSRITRRMLVKRLARAPTAEELKEPPEDIRRLALATVLRARHAEGARTLAKKGWVDPARADTTYYLFDHPEIRHRFGVEIGEIAASHWSNVGDLVSSLGSERNGPAGLPKQLGRIDPLVVAALLRCADAAHLDERRAPGFLRSLAGVRGVSERHWKFQERMDKPESRGGDRLYFSSGEPFGREDALAWWLAHDALHVCDQELRRVDDLLAEHRPQRRFQTRAVAGATNPQDLARYVRVDGWSPVDARVHTSDLADLVAKMGGEALYGSTHAVALRELLQNGIDAVKAARVSLGAPSHGHVKVLLSAPARDASRWRLEVEDNGIGMTAETLSEKLLDFGASYWNSESFETADADLAASPEFDPVGRFGIGFYSVFMVADRVTVITRHHTDSAAGTNVLEFSGLGDRAILRPASVPERLKTYGTRVIAELRVDPWNEHGGILYGSGSDTIGELVRFLAPTSPVDLLVMNGSGNALEQVVAANDWLTLDSRTLTERLVDQYASPATYGTALWDQVHEHLCQNLRFIDPKDEMLGRAAIAPRQVTHRASRTAVTVNGSALVTGGIRVDDCWSVLGVVQAEPLRAARDVAVPTMTLAQATAWVESQFPEVETLDTGLEHAISLAAWCHETVRRTGPLPIAVSSVGALNAQRLTTWVAERQEINVLDLSGHLIPPENNSLILRGWSGAPVKLDDNVLLTSWWSTPTFDEEWFERERVYPMRPAEFGPLAGTWGMIERTLRGKITELLAEAWEVPIRNLIEPLRYHTYEGPELEYATCDSERIVQRGWCFERP